jgi:hypothetical protein
MSSAGPRSSIAPRSSSRRRAPGGAPPGSSFQRHPVDYKIRRGDLPEFAPDSPRVLGWDTAGDAETVGDEVEGFEAGDEVFGMPGGVAGARGALADYQAAHADTLAPVPEALSLREAATLPIVGLMAWKLLIDSADVGEDDTVPVYGGTGGVGHPTAQVAPWAGAGEVVATGSTAGGANSRSNSAPTRRSTTNRGRSRSTSTDTPTARGSTSSPPPPATTTSRPRPRRPRRTEPP